MVVGPILYWAMACGHPYYAETSGRFARGFTARPTDSIAVRRGVQRVTRPTDTPEIQFQPRMRGT